jgi:hypothetical protein
LISSFLSNESIPGGEIQARKIRSRGVAFGATAT